MLKDWAAGMVWGPAARWIVSGVLSLEFGKDDEKQPQVLRLRWAQKNAPNSAQDDSGFNVISPATEPL
jgi:hypothetical protein